MTISKNSTFSDPVNFIQTYGDHIVLQHISFIHEQRSLTISLTTLYNSLPKYPYISVSQKFTSPPTFLQKGCHGLLTRISTKNPNFTIKRIALRDLPKPPW